MALYTFSNYWLAVHEDLRKRITFRKLLEIRKRKLTAFAAAKGAITLSISGVALPVVDGVIYRLRTQDTF